MARARPISPFTRTAPWGHAGRHRPHRMQASSTICRSRGSSPATAIASVGQTRTHAKQATHCSASMTKFKWPSLEVDGGIRPQFDGQSWRCQ